LEERGRSTDFPLLKGKSLKRFLHPKKITHRRDENARGGNRFFWEGAFGWGEKKQVSAKEKERKLNKLGEKQRRRRRENSRGGEEEGGGSPKRIPGKKKDTGQKTVKKEKETLRRGKLMPSKKRAIKATSRAAARRREGALRTKSSRRKRKRKTKGSLSIKGVGLPSSGESHRKGGKRPSSLKENEKFRRRKRSGGSSSFGKSRKGGEKELPTSISGTKEGGRRIQQGEGHRLIRKNLLRRRGGRNKVQIKSVKLPLGGEANRKKKTVGGDGGGEEEAYFAFKNLLGKKRREEIVRQKTEVDRKQGGKLH